MYVKSLRISGFKSFADATDIDLEPGVNVIVGPNGSGKSNIADALAWVLGSQAPSSLRGGSMEDVIFAGSEARPKLGIAEVALTLDNASGVLPLDLTEVTISRSADRSGLSEYRINGASCRLLDIMELLSDTGMGRSLHTVVGQGQLDAVLQARPEDRRQFIEEAAQIGKYRRRKDRSLKKIERVDDNLMRLNDVLGELARAIRPLKRQAKAAAAFSELMAEQQTLKQSLTSTELHRLMSTHTRFDPTAEDHRAQLLTDELAHVRAMLEGAAKEREELALKAEDAQRVAHGIGRAGDRLGSLARLARERSALIASRLAAETEEGYRERIRLLEGERERFETETGSLRAIADKAEGRAAEAKEEVSRTRATLESAERALGQARGRETEAAQAMVRAEGSEAAGRATVESLQARVQAVLERKEMAQRELAAAAAAIESAGNEVQALEKELDLATQKAAETETRLEQARERADSLKDQMNASHADVAAAQARVQALREVGELFADLPAATARLAPLIEESQERATVASASERDAARIVDAANQVIESAWQEVAGHDEELRRLDALMAGAADRLAGARRQHDARTVERAALDEELARVKDSLAGSESAVVELRAALPARRAEMEEARELRESADRAVSTARAELDRATEATSVAVVEARGTEERALAAQLRLEEATAGIADAHRALEGLEDLRAHLRDAKQRVENLSEVASIAAGHAASWAEEADGNAAALRDASHEADHRLNSLRQRERELDERIDEVSRKRNEAEVKRAETRARTEALGERSMEEWGLTVDDLLRLNALGGEEEEEAKTRVDKLEREIRRLGPVNPNAATEYEELAERERFLNDQIADLQSSRRDLMKIVREVDETIVEVFGKAFEDVAREFEGVFDRLFPGGNGALKLIDPTDLLNSGIEIEARPPGKNIRKLSLLSGGERSLVALAFLFSIFRARPSPFYLLDEVEAALDDVNLARFIGLMDELEQHAQILVVTHQKRTMEAGRVLYGVTMAKDGVSRVVAKRMEEITL